MDYRLALTFGTEEELILPHEEELDQIPNGKRDPEVKRFADSLAGALQAL